MSKHFEELSKNLAMGLSRRQTFLRFGAGIGAAVLGLVGRKPTSAAPPIFVGPSPDYCANVICRPFLDNGDPQGFANCVTACVRGCQVNGTASC